MPKIGGITISTIFFAMFAVAVVYTVWLHFAPRDRGEGRVARALTAAPIPIAAGFMVVVFVASMLVGVVRQYPTYSNAWANLRTFSGGCGLADDVLVEPDTNDGFMTALPGNYGPLGPLGGKSRSGSPRGVPDHIVAEAIRVRLPKPGTDYDWAAAKLKRRAPMAQLCGCPTASTRRGSRSPAPTSRRAAAEHAGLGVV